ncbi:hypothetical protein Sfulv_61030 [Streptomyces fulvorobeus]|uniref:Uncharacterized protein n=1 Tax=Streptomyces fulvorobeus TaxID=284028 RepID=A0A7J0CFL1_9ACTN|nr:hypothetical protein Sfulv_61030 [Streptomyces fulvorobeus]
MVPRACFPQDAPSVTPIPRKPQQAGNLAAQTVAQGAISVQWATKCVGSGPKERTGSAGGTQEPAGPWYFPRSGGFLRLLRLLPSAGVAVGGRLRPRRYLTKSSTTLGGQVPTLRTPME